MHTGNDALGCCDPKRCCMPGVHLLSECHTAEDYQDEHLAGGEKLNREFLALAARVRELEAQLTTAHALLRRASLLLIQWSVFYGEGRPTPASLPPAGDIEIQADIHAALVPPVSS